jgi:hypothetical protein
VEVIKFAVESGELGVSIYGGMYPDDTNVPKFEVDISSAELKVIRLIIVLEGRGSRAVEEPIAFNPSPEDRVELLIS